MADRNTNELTDHNYDGIQEYDNPVPGWWHLIFIGCILFSLVYFPVVHMTKLIKSPEERVDIAMANQVNPLYADIHDLPSAEKLTVAMGDQALLEQGGVIFKAKCAMCHGVQGQGLVGPNMRDDSYKNLSTLGEFIGVVTDGAANGAMPANKRLLNADEIAVVAAFAASLRGQPDPASGFSTPAKGPEGEEAAPW